MSPSSSRWRAVWPRVLTSPPQSWGAVFSPRPLLSRAYLFGRRRQCRAETLARRESLTAADDRRLLRPVTTPHPAGARNRLLTLTVWILATFSPKIRISRGTSGFWRLSRSGVGITWSDAVYPPIADETLRLLTLPADAASLFFRITRRPSKVVSLSDNVASCTHV